MVELGADVAFEAPELVDERGLVGADMGGGGFDGGEGHGGLEAAQPVPALEAGFDGAADVGGDVAAKAGDHLGTAGGGGGHADHGVLGDADRVWLKAGGWGGDAGLRGEAAG